jgi:hypothetical protein
VPVVVAPGVVEAGVVDVDAVEFVVDVPRFELPAGPPAWVPLLFRGPLGECDLFDFPDPVCL